MKAVINNLIEGLRTQPLALSNIVSTAMFIGAGLWILREVATSRDALISELIKSCSK